MKCSLRPEQRDAKQARRQSAKKQQACPQAKLTSGCLRHTARIISSTFLVDIVLVVPVCNSLSRDCHEESTVSSAAHGGGGAGSLD